MLCARCGSADVHRSRRKGIVDQIQKWFGRWPYRCEYCGLRFRAKGRHATRSQHENKTKTAHTTDEGPVMAFRTHEQKPQAKIIVQAESHEQLNHILLALNGAVRSYQHASKAEAQTTSHFR